MSDCRFASQRDWPGRGCEAAFASDVVGADADSDAGACCRGDDCAEDSARDTHWLNTSNGTTAKARRARCLGEAGALVSGVRRMAASARFLPD